MDSILRQTKKVLGLGEDYTVFDSDVMMHINTAFTTLQQLGVGPPEGFMITDDATTWDNYTDLDTNLNSVKSYIFLRVKLLFDPPATSFAIEALRSQITEFEWRLNVHAEGATND